MATSSLPSSENIQNPGCKCKGTCANKDGPRRSGCPCKTANRKCDVEIFKCTSTKCTNKEGYVRTQRTAARETERMHDSTNVCQTPRLSEMDECAKENSEVKEMILKMPEEKVRQLAIRVLSRGIGSLEFIQSQLVVCEEEEAPQRTNIYGSPVAVAQPRLLANLPPISDVTGGPQPDGGTQGRSGLSSDGASTSTITRSENTRPDWCKCGYCKTMSKEIENICCNKRACAAQSTRFYKLCLDPDILQLCILNRADIRNDELDNSTRQFRKAAYRQYVLDKHGYLGRGNRRVVPYCCVLKVRAKYPSPTGVYMGFRDS